jgi:hypothetical protein
VGVDLLQVFQDILLIVHQLDSMCM